MREESGQDLLGTGPVSLSEGEVVCVGVDLGSR